MLDFETTKSKLKKVERRLQQLENEIESLLVVAQTLARMHKKDVVRIPFLPGTATWRLIDLEERAVKHLVSE